jgi:hypothetical protein
VAPYFEPEDIRWALIRRVESHGLVLDWNGSSALRFAVPDAAVVGWVQGHSLSLVFPTPAAALSAEESIEHNYEDVVVKLGRWHALNPNVIYQSVNDDVRGRTVQLWIDTRWSWRRHEREQFRFAAAQDRMAAAESLLAEFIEAWRNRDKPVVSRRSSGGGARRSRIDQLVCSHCFIQTPAHLDECGACGSSLAAAA